MAKLSTFCERDGFKVRLTVAFSEHAFEQLNINLLDEYRDDFLQESSALSSRMQKLLHEDFQVLYQCFVSCASQSLKNEMIGIVRANGACGNEDAKP